MSRLIACCSVILAALLPAVGAVAESSSVMVVTYEGGKRLKSAVKNAATSITYETHTDLETPAGELPGAKVDIRSAWQEAFRPTMLIRMVSGRTHRIQLEVIAGKPNPRIDFSPGEAAAGSLGGIWR